VSVDLAWHPWTADVAEALASHVRGLLGPGEVETGRLCPRCGSAEHGRPWVRHRSRPVPVSLSRSRPHLLTAVGTVGQVGVDVESIAAVTRRWDPALVLAPGEMADTPEDRSRFWARKEAVLKAYAVGLADPMCRLVLADFPGELDDVPAPPGYVAAVVRLREGREGRSGTTTRRRGR
jgi:4'-phosphopantetheinyl transferase